MDMSDPILVLKKIHEAAAGKQGVELVVVKTSLDGQPCNVLCLSELSGDTSRLSPVAILLTGEDSQRLANPVTGSLGGLPWTY